MIVYTPVRQVVPMYGRGLRGGRLLLGPYTRREFWTMVVVLGGIAATTAASEGAIIKHMLNTGRSTAVLTAAACLIPLLALAAIVGLVVWLSAHHSGADWPPRAVRYRARVNQWRRRPVFVSGRGKESPPSVMAGGKVRVR
jgi:hypothetical protein